MSKSSLKTLMVSTILVGLLGTVTSFVTKPAPSHSLGEATRDQMRSLMRDVTSREEAYWEENATYSSEVEAIGLVVPEDVTLQIELVESNGEPIGFRAVAQSLTIDYVCRMAMEAPGAEEVMPLDSAVPASRFGFGCEGEGEGEGL